MGRIEREEVNNELAHQCDALYTTRKSPIEILERSKGTNDATSMTLRQQIFCWAMMSWIIRKRKIFIIFTIENPIEILIFNISQKNNYNSKTNNNTHPHFCYVFKDIVNIMCNFQAKKSVNTFSVNFQKRVILTLFAFCGVFWIFST